MTDPATEVVLRDRKLDLTRPALMGVVNANPDSFSDPDADTSLDRQMAQVGRLVDDGATVIDVGGQSGITNVPEVDAELERDRVAPLVAEIVAQHPDVITSVDTYKPLVVAASLDAGAHLINDVSGLRYPEVARLAGAAGAGLVVMHTRAKPKERLQDPGRYPDVVADVRDFLAEKVAQAIDLGVDEHSIVVDPGPDFAKTPAQTVEVLRNLPTVNPDGRPMLLAISRKDFVGAITRTTPKERLAGTLAAVAEVGSGEGLILRVHDVGEVRRFLQVLDVLGGRVDVPPDLALTEDIRHARG